MVDDELKLRMLKLNNQLRAIAVRVGPMHAYWDVIFDMEGFIEGRPTIIKMSAEEWIEYAESLLKNRG